MSIARYLLYLKVYEEGENIRWSWATIDDLLAANPKHEEKSCKAVKNIPLTLKKTTHMPYLHEMMNGFKKYFCHNLRHLIERNKMYSLAGCIMKYGPLSWPIIGRLLTREV